MFSRIFKVFSYLRTSEMFPIEGLPEEVLIIVFCHLSLSDLKNCLLVCRKWKNVISCQAFWKLRCQLEGKVIPSFHFDVLPKNYYKKIYLKNPYGRNLIKNPSGKEKFIYWNIMENGGHRWKVENPPAGADLIPNTDVQYCFATSFSLCSKSQTINLLAEGVDECILDNVRPDIEISEWHAARFDCGSKYWLGVQLKNSKKEVIEQFEFGPYMEEQWTGREWSQEKHVFSNYPPGVRFITFIHGGQDTQYWAGHYGSKMSAAYVKFVIT